MRKTLLLAIALLFSLSVFSQENIYIINESFDGSTLPQGWTKMGSGTNNWYISTSNISGGKPNELNLQWTPPFNGVARFVSPAVDLTDVLLSRVSPMDIQGAAQKILELRLRTGALTCGLLGIPCGLLMTTAVTFARKGNMLPLLFAVPLFIVCGFTHCVADAFYYTCVPVAFLKAHALQILGVYVCIVLGNLIGCNLYRIVLAKDQY